VLLWLASREGKEAHEKASKYVGFLLYIYVCITLDSLFSLVMRVQHVGGLQSLLFDCFGVVRLNPMWVLASV
jgi:hypothetical protein